MQDFIFKTLGEIYRYIKANVGFFENESIQNKSIALRLQIAEIQAKAITAVLIQKKSAANCGIGPNGFEHGNNCAAGSGRSFDSGSDGKKMNRIDDQKRKELATSISDALDSWEEVQELPFNDRRQMLAETKLEAVVKDALLASVECDEVVYEMGSAGSRYFECFNDEHDVSIKFRVSNHKSGRRGNENAGDIVLGDSITEIERQLQAAADAMSEAIAEAE